MIPKTNSLQTIGPQQMEYERAFELQNELLKRCIESEGKENFLLLLEHTPTITIGRTGDPSDVTATSAVLSEKGVKVVQTNRGGKVTFHGPGQLVAYPIIDLHHRSKDLHRYLKDLQNWLIALLGEFDIQATGSSPHTGVWTTRGKVASIGIAVRRWCTYHGIALNIAPDMSFFDLLNPCGLREIPMVSMAQLTDKDVSFEYVVRRAEAHFRDYFGFAPSVETKTHEVGAR
ncbi:MAG: lipoyl(octanoyl) transferase LipB [Planctomycetes bacterium]|nr:lipoyl(octanoyl) transferase LipB [Planctomycetota bacterium]